MSNQYEQDPQPGPEGRNGPSWFLIALVIMAVICAVFVFQNRDPATVEFLLFSLETKVWVAIAVAIALGIVLDRLILAWWRRARKRRND